MCTCGFQTGPEAKPGVLTVSAFALPRCASSWAQRVLPTLVTAFVLLLLLPGAALATTAPTAFTEDPTIVDATDATLMGYISDTGGLDTTYYFGWGTAGSSYCTGGGVDAPPNQTSNHVLLGSDSGSSVSAPLSGLTSGSSYCYELYASNTVGPATGTGVINFVSGAPNVNTDDYAITGGTAANIVYDANAADQSSTVEVLYDTLSNSDNWCTNALSGTVTTGAASHTTPTAFPFSDNTDHSDQILGLTGLTPGTSYCAVVEITNGSESNVLSPYAVEFTAGAPSLFVTSVQATGASTGTVTADINPNGQSGVQYYAEWDEVGTAFCNDPQNNTPGVTGGTTSGSKQTISGTGEDANATVNITGLVAQHNYCALVVAVTTDGVSNLQDVNFEGYPLTFTGGVPTAQTNDASGTGPTSGQVDGSVNPSGQSTTYDAEYWQANGDGSCPDVSTTPLGTTSPVSVGSSDSMSHSVSVTIDSLSANTTYCALIVAQNTSGNSNQDVNAQTYAVEFTTGAPGVTTDPDPTVGATTATITGSVDPVGASTTYWVDYALATSTFCTAQNTADSSIQQTSHQTLADTDSTYHAVAVNLSSLTTNTQYCAEVVANNASGTTYGTPAVLFTPAAKPLVSADSATPTGGANETLSGTVNPNGQSTTYQFLYDLANTAWCMSNGTSGSAGFSSPASPASAGSGTSATQESANLSTLTAGNQYCWALEGTNASGTTTSFGGTFNVGLPSATTNAATSISNTGATLNGQVNPDGNDTEYSFAYAPSTSLFCTSGGTSGIGSATATAQQSVGFTDTSAHAVSATISGLSAATSYCYAALASNVVGRATGSTVTFVTPGGSHVLTVIEAGAGSGTVAGGGISCPGTCTKSFTAGSQVTLSAAPASGSTFAGWSGACSGTGSCTVTMSADRTVTATFKPIPAKPTCHLKALSLKGKSGSISFSTSCNQAASGTVGASLKEKKKPKKTFRLTAHASLSANSATKITLKLPRAAVKALKKKNSLSGKVVLTASNANGTSTVTITVTVR